MPNLRIRVVHEGVISDRHLFLGATVETFMTSFGGDLESRPSFVAAACVTVAGTLRGWGVFDVITAV